MTDTIPDAVIEAMKNAAGHASINIAADSTKPFMHDFIHQILRAAEAVGWVLVPVKPTVAMVKSCDNIMGSSFGNNHSDVETWEYMLAARPRAPGDAPLGDGMSEDFEQTEDRKDG